LLEYPNPRTSGFEFRRGTTSDIAIYDTAYWWKVGARPGAQPARLYRIPPDLVVPRGGDIFKGPHHYDILGPEGTFPLTPEEVVDFGGYHPQDTRVGSSPLESLAAVLNEEVEASRHRAYYWKNAARREGVIERPIDAPEWDSEMRDRFAVSWRNRMAGGDKSGETGILEDGMKWNPDSFSPRDSEFIAGREFTLDTAASVYQIPLAMLGRKGTQTYASMREYHKVLYVDVLGPWNARIEGAVQLQLVPDFNEPGLYVEFNIDEKLQGDFEQQSDAIRSAVQVPWMSVNQALKLRNLPPVGDPEDDTNPFNFPARPTAYMYEGEERPTSTPSAPDNPPQGGENMPMNGHSTDPIASMNDLAAILEDIT
jgi:HK97 family phage portal protein